MLKLGSKERPIIVRVNSEERLSIVAKICEENGWEYIAGLEAFEDITDLKKAFKEKYAPADVYAPCSCGSGKKYKFCCAKKNLELPL